MTTPTSVLLERGESKEVVLEISKRAVMNLPATFPGHYQAGM